jgi:uncharacterized protein (TIGR02391 family)
MAQLHTVPDHQRGYKVSLYGHKTTLGDLHDMSASELGWFFLEAFTDDGQNEWSAPDVVSDMHRRIGEQEPSYASNRNYKAVHRSVVSQLVADGFSWLISAGFLGPGSNSSGSSGYWRVTSAGYDALPLGSGRVIENRQRLHVDLHPDLQGVCKVTYERGEYDTAVFTAMRAVEVAVRDAAGLGPHAYGDGVMTEAFRADGPLAEEASTKSEREAYLKLFSGAYGVFRHPAAHNNITYHSPTEAADILHLADILLRIVDRRKSAQSPGAGEGNA